VVEMGTGEAVGSGAVGVGEVVRSGEWAVSREEGVSEGAVTGMMVG